MSDQAKNNTLLCFMVLFLIGSYYFQHSKAVAANKELQTRNAYALLMPLVELYTDSGALSGNISAKTKKVHVDSYIRYTESIKEYQLSVPLRPFALGREKIDIAALEEIPDKIKPGSDERAYKVAIKNFFFAELKQFFKNENVLPRKSGSDEKCRTRVAKVLSDLHTTTEEYLAIIGTLGGAAKTKVFFDKAFNKALYACGLGRDSVGNCYLSAYTYEDFFLDKEPLIIFGEDIDLIIHCNKVLRDSLPATDDYEIYRERLGEYTHSELERRIIVQLLIEDDIQKAGKLLLARMEKAIANCK